MEILDKIIKGRGVPWLNRGNSFPGTFSCSSSSFSSVNKLTGKEVVNEISNLLLLNDLIHCSLVDCCRVDCRIDESAK